MLKSEQDQQILYEAFHSVGTEVKRQNKVMGVILGCMLVGAVVLFCLLML